MQFMATDGGLSGTRLIIEPGSPFLLRRHLSNKFDVILTPGQALTSYHQSCALRDSHPASLRHGRQKKKDMTKITSMGELSRIETGDIAWKKKKIKPTKDNQTAFALTNCTFTSVIALVNNTMEHAIRNFLFFFFQAAKKKKKKPISATRTSG